MYALLLSLVVNMNGVDTSMDIEISYQNKMPCEMSAKSMPERIVTINGQVAQVLNARCVRK